MNMNGVTRFLSRREKNHEKRSSKHIRSKVRPTSPYTPHSSDHFLSSVDGSSPDACSRRRLQRPQCLRHMYRMLPSPLASLAQSGVPLLCKKPPTTEISQYHIEVSTTQSSDHLTLQSRQTQAKVPTELYKVFTNEDEKPSDKDEEKKVRC